MSVMNRFYLFVQISSFGPATASMQVHDDGVVMIAAADFTLYSTNLLHWVIDDPADRSISKSGRTCISFAQVTIPWKYLT